MIAAFLNLFRVKEKTGEARVKHHLVESAFLMAILTLVSRILGMLRDIVCAQSYGTSWQWDGFIYAFMIPNFFRRLVAEGAVSSAFIPVYSQVLTQKGKDRAIRFANTTFTLCSVIFLLVLAVTEVVLSFLLETGKLPQTLVLTVDLLRYFFPYLFIVSLIAIGMGILNSHKHFFTPYLGPIILNVFWIAAVLWIVPRISGEITVQLRWLSIIILISAALQLIIQIPPLHQLGFTWRPVWDWFSSEIRRSFQLFIPAVFGFAVVPLNMLVDMTLGLLIGEGANSSLWYGNRLMQLPLGVFAISLGTALLPNLSHQIAQGKLQEAEDTFRFSLKTIFLIIVPCTVGFMVLSQPIVEMLFERGEFDAVSTARTSAVLFCYSIGLFAYSGHKILTTGFYAHQDTKTPVRIAIFSLLLNIVLNLILMKPFREAGLALATSLCSIIQFGLLMYFCQKSVMAIQLKDLLFSSLKILFASCLMGGGSLWVFGLVPTIDADRQTLSLAIRVFSTIAASIPLYVLICLILRIQEMKSALSWLSRKFKSNK